MNKKIPFAIVASLLLLVSACSKEETKEPSKPAAQEQQKEVTFKGLKLTPQITIEGKKVTGKIDLENTSNEPIILQKESDRKLIQLDIESQQGGVLYENVVTDKNRDEIQPMEKVTFNVNGELSKEDEKYLVDLKVLLKDSKTIKYTKTELSKSYWIVPPKKDLSFLPESNKTYTYYDNNKQGEVTEKFLFFNDNLVQSQSAAEGKKVYFEDETGIYVVHDNDFSDETINILESVKTDTKKMIIKFPVTVGSTWTTDGVTYEVRSVTETVKTPYKEFTDVVKIALDNGTELYYDKEIGLIQISYDGNVMQQLQKIN